jgi:hypothetical protein
MLTAVAAAGQAWINQKLEGTTLCTTPEKESDETSKNPQ